MTLRDIKLAACSSKLAYCADEDDLATDMREHPELEKILFDPSPLGCVATFSKNGSVLFIAYRGTDIHFQSSGLAVDLAIGLNSGGDGSKLISAVLSACGNIDIDPLAIQILQHLIKSSVPANSTVRSAASIARNGTMEIMQAFMFRALSFAHLAIAECERKFPQKKKIIITGHSLGGVYAQVVGKFLNLQSIVFNSPGARSFYDQVIQCFAPYYVAATATNVAVHHSFIIKFGDQKWDAIGAFGKPIGRAVELNYNRHTPAYLNKVAEVKERLFWKFHLEAIALLKASISKGKLYDRAKLAKAEEAARHSSDVFEQYYSIDLFLIIITTVKLSLRKVNALLNWLLKKKTKHTIISCLKKKKCWYFSRISRQHQLSSPLSTSMIARSNIAMCWEISTVKLRRPLIERFPFTNCIKDIQFSRLRTL